MDIFYKYGLLIVAVMLITTVTAQEIVTKKIEKRYELNNAGEVYLDNKYGEVLIYGWDKNAIEIEATIKITHKKKEKAESLLNRISSNIRSVSNFITIKTEIGNKEVSTFSKYFNKVNPFDFDRANVQIDYTIHMPSNAEISIINKFGDVIISDWNGKLKASLQHGDLWINESLTNATVNMKFGKLNTKSILHGNVTIKNGKINIDEANTLELTSSGSTINATKIGSLVMNSNKDEIFIDKAHKIEGDMKFSDLKIKELKSKINLNTKLADVKISKITTNNAHIKFTQESSTISIHIARNNSFVW